MDTRFLLLIILPVSLIFLWQWRTLQKARHSEGQIVPDTSAIDGDIKTTCRVYYFHAAHCGPCRVITPWVDSFREEHPNLIKVDIVEHLELAQNFAIAATPSFIAIANGIISEVKLGAVKEKWLLSRLTGC